VRYRSSLSIGFPGKFHYYVSYRTHQGRNTTLVMADEVSGHEPLTQIGTGLVKDGASRDRVLISAPGALENTRASGKVICLGRLVLVASKSIGPAQRGKCLNTGVFITVFVAESKKSRDTGISDADGDYSSSMVCLPTPGENFRLIPIRLRNHRL
jgi:hypothetical protein